MMRMVAAVRLDHDQLRQIVADHVRAKLGVEIAVPKVSLYQSPDDRTGCRIEASIDVSDYAEVGGTSSVGQGEPR